MLFDVFFYILTWLPICFGNKDFITGYVYLLSNVPVYLGCKQAKNIQIKGNNNAKLSVEANSSMLTLARSRKCAYGVAPVKESD